MDTLINLYNYLVIGTILGAIFLFVDPRKENKRFKNGYENNEERNVGLMEFGFILMVIAGAGLLTMRFFDLKPNQVAAKNFNLPKNIKKSKRWKYHDNVMNSYAIVFNGDNYFLYGCNIKHQQPFYLLGNLKKEHDYSKVKISFGKSRKPASIDSITIESNKNGNLELGEENFNNLKKGKTVTFSYEKIKTKFGLSGSTKTLSRVLKDCHSKEK